MYPERQRSNWWYLLPLFLGLIGSLIAYFALRHDDPVKARNCIYLGLVLAALTIAINFLIDPQIAEISEDIEFDINA